MTAFELMFWASLVLVALFWDALIYSSQQPWQHLYFTVRHLELRVMQLSQGPLIRIRTQAPSSALES